MLVGKALDVQAIPHHLDYGTSVLVDEIGSVERIFLGVGPELRKVLPAAK